MFRSEAVLIQEEVELICADLMRAEIIDRFLGEMFCLIVKNFDSFLVLFLCFVFWNVIRIVRD